MLVKSLYGVEWFSWIIVKLTVRKLNVPMTGYSLDSLIWLKQRQGTSEFPPPLLATYSMHGTRQMSDSLKLNPSTPHQLTCISHLFIIFLVNVFQSSTNNQPHSMNTSASVNSVKLARSLTCGTWYVHLSTNINSVRCMIMNYTDLAGWADSYTK